MDLNAKLSFYRISESEYRRICDLLGRPPLGVEWALFSALWSEHCSYKSSKKHLRELFRESPRVVQSFGENAGVIDLGEGERIAFKMESHNHPSFIEPYQGAATGVGGILRDIFTMGARPVALANYLCFGQPQAARMTSLIDGVVRGIGGYGNCVGVPTVTGQTEFDASYDGNILVNAMAVGLFRPGEQVFTAKAQGPGNWVVYVGAKTGKDGVHGASMASESFAEDSEAKRPNVQIGDPFFEKLLIESCLEVMEKNLVVAIQDMGAAGLTSSAFEMAARGEVGFAIHLDKVPLRDSSVTPEEILLSESQERMLLICEPRNFAQLQEVYHRWGLDATVIGEVTAERKVRLSWHGETLADLDPRLLVDEAPEYDRPFDKWIERKRVANGHALGLDFADPLYELKAFLSDPRGSSRRWIYRQYDQRVGGKTMRDAEESVAVLRLPDSGRALGIVLGARPHVLRFDAQQGGYDSVAYPALELAAKGFEPLAVTDCLNFGNPEKPQVMSQFVAATQAMSEMCAALQTPIISGNVSFYNETLGKNVTPTPATGLVGLRDGLDSIPRSHFVRDGDEIYIVRLPELQMGGLAEEIHHGASSGWGEVSAKPVAEFTRLIRHLALQPGVQSTRVVGKFGLAYALARMCIGGNVGCRIDMNALLFDKMGEHRLFSEVCYEVIFAVKVGDAEAFARAFHVWVNGNGVLKETLSDKGEYTNVECRQLGMSGGDRLQLGASLDATIDELSKAYYEDWGNQLENLA